MAVRYDIIKKAGAWFDIIDRSTGEVLNQDKIQGQANVYAYLEANEQVLMQVEQQCNEAMGILA